MIPDHSAMNSHHWLEHKFAVAQPVYDKLTQYLHSGNEQSDFPLVIFSDHFPAKGEIEKFFGNELFLQSQRSVILAVNTKNGKANSDHWHLLKSGIDDIIEWQQEEEIIEYLKSKLERDRVIQDVLKSALVQENLVGKSVVWKMLLSDVVEATLFSQASILLIGESGTGKELVSRLIHTIDKRPDKKKMIVVDCTTIVPELSGSELFGHERGSYTNAVQSREGAFALANGGTLFLDEAGELPLRLQAELLRVLQEGTFKKVGSNTWQKTSFRLICATNKDLRKAVEKGRFRQDLYFRIADCEFRVPSLAERKDDIPFLVNHFLSKIFPSEQCPEVDKPVMDYFVQREYPGNVRELKQLVQRIAMRHLQHKKITIGEIPEKDRIFTDGSQLVTGSDGIEELVRRAILTGEDWWKLKDKISETAIRVALELENNNKQKAAERLGVDVRTVQQYVKKKSNQE